MCNRDMGALDRVNDGLIQDHTAPTRESICVDDRSICLSNFYGRVKDRLMRERRTWVTDTENG